MAGLRHLGLRLLVLGAAAGGMAVALKRDVARMDAESQPYEEGERNADAAGARDAP